MTPALIFAAAQMWKAGCDTKKIDADPIFRKAKVTEDDIWNRMGAIRTLARSISEPERISA